MVSEALGKKSEKTWLAGKDWWVPTFGGMGVAQWSIGARRTERVWQTEGKERDPSPRSRRGQGGKHGSH